MLHSRLFKETARFRDAHFQPTRDSLESTEQSTSTPWLDGNPQIDRPLFVQFCANQPQDLLEAAMYVAPYCDAVDLNLGCPQGIAKSGRYGAFLQEDWDTIYKLINKLHKELPVPVTAKMRILDTKEKTLEYAKMILSAGASILTVHGRRREQKGHNMGVADWQMIRYLRDNLPAETVLFANGNILNSEDLQPCLEATGADGIMSAEGNLSDPTIFATPPPDRNNREYWYGPNGTGGYRLDGVFRRYLDIIHKYVFDTQPPKRSLLFLPSDPVPEASVYLEGNRAEDGPPTKKQKKERAAAVHSPNLKAMQGHLFQLLRPMLSLHTDIRDALSKTRTGDIAAFERILSMVEEAVKRGLQEAEKDDFTDSTDSATAPAEKGSKVETIPLDTIAKYKRPWWVCQPYIRPLPEEALKIGSMTMSKKNKAKAVADQNSKGNDEAVQRTDEPNESILPGDVRQELPQAALVCG